MLMRDKLALEFYQLDVLPVQLAHDLRAPVIMEESELLTQVHLGDRSVSEDLRRSPSLSMDLSFPYHQIRARRRECSTPGDDPQKGHRSDDSYLRPTRNNPLCKLSRCGSRSPKGSISSSGRPTSSREEIRCRKSGVSPSGNPVSQEIRCQSIRKSGVTGNPVSVHQEIRCHRKSG